MEGRMSIPISSSLNVYFNVLHDRASKSVRDGSLKYEKALYMTSNQLIFIGLRSSKNYYKRPGSGVGIWEGSLGCEFFAWVDVC